MRSLFFMLVISSLANAERVTLQVTPNPLIPAGVSTLSSESDFFGTKKTNEEGERHQPSYSSHTIGEGNQPKAGANDVDEEGYRVHSRSYRNSTIGAEATVGSGAPLPPEMAHYSSAITQ